MHSAISGLSSSRTALLSSELSSLSSLLNLCSSFLKSLWSFSSTSWDSSIIPRRLARVGLAGPVRFRSCESGPVRSAWGPSSPPRPSRSALPRSRGPQGFVLFSCFRQKTWKLRKLGKKKIRSPARERESNRVDRGGDRGRKVGRLVALSSLAQMV